MSQSFAAASPQFAAMSDQLQAAPAGSRLLTLFQLALGGLDAAIDAVGIDVVCAQFEALYDAYVTPLDIPGIDDRIEPAIDAAIKGTLVAMIRKAHAAIHKD